MNIGLAVSCDVFTKWCNRKFVVWAAHEESFEIHGDLEDTWRKSYCPGLRKVNVFKNRDQSLDPDLALRALRCFARWLKKGPHTKPVLSRESRIQLELLKALGKKKRARKLAYGFQTSDDDSSSSSSSSSDSDGTFFVPPKVRRKKKKRKRRKHRSSIEGLRSAPYNDIQSHR